MKTVLQVLASFVLAISLPMVVMAQTEVPIRDHDPNLAGTTKPSKMRCLQAMLLRVFLEDDKSLSIEYTGNHTLISYRILNEQEEEVISGADYVSNTNSVSVDLSSLPAGTYNIEILINNSVKVGTFQL